MAPGDPEGAGRAGERAHHSAVRSGARYVGDGRTGLGGCAAILEWIAAGTRAVEHLALIAIEAELVPLRTTVLMPKVHVACSASNDPVDLEVGIALAILLEDLAWWANLLQ